MESSQSSTDSQANAAADTAIRSAIDRFAAAIRAKDINGAMSLFAPDVLSYDLAPPLRHGGGEDFRQHWRVLSEAYEGDIGYEIRDLHIAVSSDLAFSHSLNRTSGTLRNGQHTDRWLRW